MNLSKEEALRLHRKMWSDMQKEFGDCPSAGTRVEFKEDWCNSHGYKVRSDCFLCEYDYQVGGRSCKNCPIDWSSLSTNQLDRCYAEYKGVVNNVFDVAIFLAAPISEILALPERK